MKTFDELQTVFDELENSFHNINSHKKDIIDLNNYDRNKELNENQYLRMLELRNNYNKQNAIKNEKIDAEKATYNTKLNELVGNIEIEDVWLVLPNTVIKRKGDTIHVYDNLHIFQRVAQGIVKNSPTIYKILD